MKERAPVGIYGLGLTGAMLAEELPDAALFDRSDARVTPFGARARVASIEEAVAAVGVLVLVAGPYAETMDAALEAARAHRTNIIHLCCELGVLEGLQKRDEEFRRAGIAIVGPAGFSTMVSELLVWLARRGKPARRVELAHAMTKVIPSEGTLLSYLSEVDGPGYRVSNGSLTEEAAGARMHVLDFGGTIGPRVAVSAPLPELLPVARTSGAEECEAYVGTLHPNAMAVARQSLFFRNRETLTAMLRVRRGTPGPNASERSSTRFSIAARVFTAQGEQRLILGHGSDPWRMTISCAAMAARSVSESPYPGNHYASQVLDPQRALASLAKRQFRWRLVAA